MSDNQLRCPNRCRTLATEVAGFFSSVLSQLCAPWRNKGITIVLLQNDSEVRVERAYPCTFSSRATPCRAETGQLPRSNVGPTSERSHPVADTSGESHGHTTTVEDRPSRTATVDQMAVGGREEGMWEVAVGGERGGRGGSKGGVGGGGRRWERAREEMVGGGSGDVGVRHRFPAPQC